MSEMPLHTHLINHDGGKLPVTVPVSVLDCDQPRCQQRAETARRGTYYSLEYIERRGKEARASVDTAIKHAEFWELIKEAKLRKDKGIE